jgi:hypothetical protein
MKSFASASASHQDISGCFWGIRHAIDFLSIWAGEQKNITVTRRVYTHVIVKVNSVVLRVP